MVTTASKRVEENADSIDQGFTDLFANNTVTTLHDTHIFPEGRGYAIVTIVYE